MPIIYVMSTSCPIWVEPLPMSVQPRARTRVSAGRRALVSPGAEPLDETNDQMPEEEHEQQRDADDDEGESDSIPPGERASPADTAALPRRELRLGEDRHPEHEGDHDEACPSDMGDPRPRTRGLLVLRSHRGRAIAVHHAIKSECPARD